MYSISRIGHGNNGDTVIIFQLLLGTRKIGIKYDKTVQSQVGKHVGKSNLNSTGIGGPGEEFLA